MKKVLSIILLLAMLATMFTGLSFTAQAADNQTTTVKASDLKTGNLIEFGSYPQSKVTDSELISVLDSIECTMTNYGYMQNSKTIDMSYADIEYDGTKYRKVSINEIRLQDTTSSRVVTNKNFNGLTIGKSYYFKYEPIIWQVLANEDDGIYLMSKKLLDNQPFNNYNEYTTWESSSLRGWLNNDFYNTAFSEKEKGQINSVTHENEDNPSNGTEGGNDTTDNIWILSYSDAINSNYGFSSNYDDKDTARQAQGSDYAKSQGLSADKYFYIGNSWWWLRTPDLRSDDYSVYMQAEDSGYLSGECGAVYYNNGVRPAFKLNLNAEAVKLNSNNSTGTSTQTNVATPVADVNNTPNQPAAGQTCVQPAQQATTAIHAIQIPNSTEITSLESGIGGFTVKWSKVDNVKGYEIQYSLNENMKNYHVMTVQNNESTEQTLSNLEQGKTYYVRIRCYIVVSGKKYYSLLSDKKSVVTKSAEVPITNPAPTPPDTTETIQPVTVSKPKATKIKKLNKGKKSFTVQWKKASGVTGYQVQYSLKKNMKPSKTKKVKGAKKTKITVKKLKKGKKYYVRIRTYKTVNGEKVYSKWSAKKTVKTK